jgi:N-acetylmuramic acid 6-phosphate etherase
MKRLIHRLTHEDICCQGLCLGIEGGGTKTVAVAVDPGGRLLKRIEAGMGNVRLLSDSQLAALFLEIAGQTGIPVSVAIGLAGAREESDRFRIRAAAQIAWPGVPCVATNDLETGLAAAELEAKGRKPAARILVISGTGSCCYGKNQAGGTVKIGGWGHVLGDQGSGYAIGKAALQSVIEAFDATGKWPELGAQILRRLLLNEPNELIHWAHHAGKDEMAALAVDVFEAVAKGDRLARSVITEAAGHLARDAIRCAARLAPAHKPVDFFLTGGVFLTQGAYAAAFTRRLLKRCPKAAIRTLEGESVWGSVQLALRAAGSSAAALPVAPVPPAQAVLSGRQAACQVLSPTEQRNPRSMNLDRLSIHEAVELMLSEDAAIPRAILEQREAIEKTIALIVRRMKKGGRLFYVGAGTSGRLGVLDASECPPTFRTDPDRVQGIIAGGQRALWLSVEGAEDDREAGGRSMVCRGVEGKDVVVGIAASGGTPFVHGALAEARKRKAATVLLAFNPHVELAPGGSPDILIAVDVGPEILTGSTRLKSGTATKMILNMLTTLSMVKLGKVVSNLMVDLNPSNVKLRDRAVRIVSELTGASPEAARDELEKQGWQVAAACQACRGRANRRDY